MGSIMDWEVFCTDSKNGEDKADVIYINEREMGYVLALDYEHDADLMGMDEDEVNYSTYVSRFVFDIIVDAVKQRNFKRLKEVLW